MPDADATPAVASHPPLPTDTNADPDNHQTQMVATIKEDR